MTAFDRKRKWIVSAAPLGRRQFLKKEEDTKTDNHDEENEKAHAKDQLFLANEASHKFPQKVEPIKPSADFPG
jgi:hypothetical protein